jgi:hypothetical protein
VASDHHHGDENETGDVAAERFDIRGLQGQDW